MKVGTVRKKDISDFNETILDFIGTPPGKKHVKNDWNHFKISGTCKSMSSFQAWDEKYEMPWNIWKHPPGSVNMIFIFILWDPCHVLYYSAFGYFGYFPACPPNTNIMREQLVIGIVLLAALNHPLQIISMIFPGQQVSESHYIATTRWVLSRATRTSPLISLRWTNQLELILAWTTK